MFPFSDINFKDIVRTNGEIQGLVQVQGFLKDFIEDFSRLCEACLSSVKNGVFANSWIAPDVTAAMLVYRTMAKRVFREFDFIIMQNLKDILLLFCTPTWPSHHVSTIQE